MQTLLTKAQDNLRSLYQIDEGLINFASNDYLGLASSPLSEEFLSANKDKFLAGISSRLLGASAKASGELEELAKSIFDKEALLFNSGFLANYSCLQALAKLPKTLFVADKSIHASCIDAIKAFKFKRYFHNDYEHLKSILEQNHKLYENIIIISEGLFSMDADCANLSQLVSLKKEFSQSCKIWLYIDEAHSIGCLGENGYGLVASSEFAKEVDFCLVTFSKALSGIGAVMLSDKLAKDYFTNFARGLIYSTSLPELNVAYNAFILKKLASFNAQRQALMNNCAFLNEQLNKLGIYYLGKLYIKLIVLAEPKAAVLASKALKEQGFFAPAIRPPTVASNLSGLRISLNAAFNHKELSEFAQALRIVCENR